MPVEIAKKAIISNSKNGLGAFILQCKRLDFHYCDWAGSSRGMNHFLKHTLPHFAKKHPQIEIHVSPRPRKEPMVRGHYINGLERSINVKNLEKEMILQKVEALRDSSGQINRKTNKPVTSTNESIRGIWSPFHANEHTPKWQI